MLIFSQRLRSSGNLKKAFTLIELLVVVSIMLVLTVMFLFRQQQFNSSTLLRTLSYSIALSVRQAQVYGTSVRELDTTTVSATPTFAPAFGLYFSGTSASTYILFADVNNNGQYESANEAIETFTLSSGYVINGVCAVLANGTERCTSGTLDTSGVATITHMHILFKRPNPDAVFTAYNGVATIPGECTPVHTYKLGQTLPQRAVLRSIQQGKSSWVV